MPKIQRDLNYFQSQKPDQLKKNWRKQNYLLSFTPDKTLLEKKKRKEKFTNT